MPDNSDCSRIPAPSIWAPKKLVTVKPDMVEVSMQNAMNEIEKQTGSLTSGFDPSRFTTVGRNSCATLPQYGHRLQDHGPEYRTFETTCLYLFLVGFGRGEGCQLL